MGLGNVLLHVVNNHVYTFALIRSFRFFFQWWWYIRHFEPVIIIRSVHLGHILHDWIHHLLGLKLVDARNHVFVWGCVELEVETTVLIIRITNSDAKYGFRYSLKLLYISDI